MKMIHERVAARLAHRTDLGIATCERHLDSIAAGFMSSVLGIGKHRAQSAIGPHVVVWFYSPGEPKPITEITAEVAASPRKRAVGLSRHKVLHPATGMLFLQPGGPAERHETFHVGGVQFPFDLIFVRRDHRIGKIVHDIQPDDPGRWGYRRTSAVIEVVGGFCKAHGIKLGDEVGFGHAVRTAQADSKVAQGDSEWAVWSTTLEKGGGYILRRFPTRAQALSYAKEIIRGVGARWSGGDPTDPKDLVRKVAQAREGWMMADGHEVRSTNFAMVRTAGTFDGSTPCSLCGSTPPAGDWSSPDGLCEACAERRDASRLGFDASGRVRKANGDYCDACDAHAPGQLKPVFTGEDPPEIKFLCPACKKADVYGCEPGEPLDERAAQLDKGRTAAGNWVVMIEGAGIGTQVIASYPSEFAANEAAVELRGKRDSMGSNARIGVTRRMSGSGRVSIMSDAEIDGLLRQASRIVKRRRRPVAPVSEVPSGKPVQTQPEQQAPKPTGKAPKTARDLEEDERQEHGPLCVSCRQEEGEYEAPGGLLCGRCYDELLIQEPGDDWGMPQEGQAQTHDLLRTITEASRRGQLDEARCPQCDEPVGPGGSCEACGASFAEFERMSAGRQAGAVPLDAVSGASRQAAFPAKFRGTCRVCGQYIDVGAMINWSKASGASHQSCGTPSTSRPSGGGYRRRDPGHCFCADPACECADRCMCDSSCNCRGGNIYDC